jgi:AraC-like DNA-binding protein
VIVYDRHMDPLVDLLDGPRARGAFLLRSLLDPPWSLRIVDEAPLTVVAVTQRAACVLPDDGVPVRLEAGDLALVRGPGHYTVADDPSTAPQVVIHPGQVCTTLEGESLAQEMHLGVRTWGNAPGGVTSAATAVLLTGTYQMTGELSERLLAALPAVLVLRHDEWDCPLLDLLADEIVRDEPGQEAVLDRLLDLVLIAALRTWLARPDATAPGWYRALDDPIVGRALRMIQHHPEEPWTVASLARATGVSRAALARRFTDLVGEPPMTFLTSWRLALAADLLREPGSTIGAIASRVGYGSPYALSAAFKRVRGVSPQHHRANAARA